MNRSTSEVCFQKFLQGAEAEPEPEPEPEPEEHNPTADSDSDDVHVDVVQVEASPPPAAHVDPGEYALALKKKLDIYCAAVAKSRGSKDSPLLGLQSSANESGFVVTGGISHLATQNSVVGAKLTMSCSSKELSEENEEDLEGENDTNDDMDPTNAKRMRRMISNRESARRSRRRKQAHVNELETEVLQLRVENKSLLKRLTDMTQKYNDTSVDNRVLKADVETLRAKVKMAEDKAERVTGMDDELYHSISDISSVILPFSLGAPEEISDASVPANGVPNRFSEPTNELIGPDIEPTGMVMDRTVKKTGRSCTLKRVASLERLQKRMCCVSGSCDPNQWDAATWDDNKAPDEQK